MESDWPLIGVLCEQLSYGSIWKETVCSTSPKSTGGVDGLRAAGELGDYINGLNQPISTLSGFRNMLVNIWKGFKARSTRAVTFVTFLNNRCVIIQRDYTRGGCNLVILSSPSPPPLRFTCAPTDPLFGYESIVPFCFISHWRWFQELTRLHAAFVWVWHPLITAFPIAWFMFGVQKARQWLRGRWRSAVWMSVVQTKWGVNGRFIYHRCHSPPERKSALPNWNIAEFTLLIRALSAALSSRLSSSREQRCSDI